MTGSGEMASGKNYTSTAFEAECGVLRNIYECVESSVLVGDACSRFFQIDVGVRQGCLLSPILFALYINGLAEELKKANLGAKIVQYDEEQIGILMFADDIGLVSDQKKQLEELMKRTFEYSLKWRFSFNYDKCAVVIFDHRPNVPKINHGDCVQECKCGFHWKLGDRLIKQEAMYKYLGIELDRRLLLKQFSKRICEKARQSMSAMCGVWECAMDAWRLKHALTCMRL